MARLPWWRSWAGDEQPSRDDLARFAAYLRDEAANDMAGSSADRALAMDALKWIADCIDINSSMPFFLYAKKKSRHRPKSTGVDWFSVGQDFEDAMEKEGAIRKVVIHDIANKYSVTCRTIESAVSYYKQAMDAYWIMVQKEMEDENKSQT